MGGLFKSYLGAVMTREHPFEVTQHTQPLGGLIQAYRHHSSHNHKNSRKYKTFHGTFGDTFITYKKLLLFLPQHLSLSNPQVYIVQ